MCIRDRANTLHRARTPKRRKVRKPTMRTSRLFLNRLNQAPDHIDAVVVIDVLRAFSVAAYALSLIHI